MAHEAVGEVLPGVAIEPLAEGFVALDVVVLVKCLNEEGEPVWALRNSGGIGPVEMIGALTVMHDHAKIEFERTWITVDDDD